MLTGFVTVGTQVLIMFILMAVGYSCGKLKLFNDGGVKCMNDFVFYFVTPCVIITSYQREFDARLLRNLLLSILSALLTHVVGIIIGLIVFKNHEEPKKTLYRFAAIFSNSGFMALPLIDALLGSEGVFYGAGYIAVLNAAVWSYGQYMMAKGKEGFDMKKIIINPGVLPVIVGMILFFASISLPEIILSPMNFLAGLNTPIPMAIIGYTMSKTDLRSIFKLGKGYIAIAIRLVAVPLVMLAILYPLGYRGTLLVSCMVSASAPVAAMTTMFSIKFGKDEQTASKIVSASTLLSIVTMTLIVGFAQAIS